MKFNSSVYFGYQHLTFLEKKILKYCCYYPPKQRRKRNELIINPTLYIQTLTNAFGEEFWRLINHKRVLDFGCGEGQFVIAMATKSSGQFEGVDIQDQFQVVDKYVENHQLTNAKFHLGNSDKFEDASYDVIISHDSFEHFEKPEIVLKEMVRLLKPNGKLLIKFGPTWMSPYGRHMSGTYKKSWPWIHLLIPERSMMRIHSVYHNDAELFEKYVDLPGGLNKMTIKKAKSILKKNSNIKIEKIQITPWRGLFFMIKFSLLKELFGSGVYFKIVKVEIN